MLFNSYSFIVFFLPVVLMGFLLLSRVGQGAAARLFLVAASLFFYGWWNPSYLLLLVPSILVNYAIGTRLVASPVREAQKNRFRLLLAGIGINLGLIGYFKYANFFVDSVNAVAGSSFHLETIILPLAISFFTFQQIAFLVDSYQRKVASQSLVNYALFVSFFPQLIAGPIVHHVEMMPQFARKPGARWARNLLIGLVIFSIGLAKKVLIADTIAPYGNTVFDAAADGAAPSFFMAWQGALAYSLQLYFDFSGYSDMAIGLARMFGIRLPLNFHSPYKARNIVEFWRRWHMTLSRFLRDYVYIPLGGNRFGQLFRLRNLFLTMLIGGLWHGAGWTFVFWGALHGVYLVVCHGWGAALRAAGLASVQHSRFYGIWAHSVTLLSVIVAWVFFRATSFDAALLVLKGMFGGTAFDIPRAVGARLPQLSDVLSALGVELSAGSGSAFVSAWVLIFLGSFVALFCPNTQDMMLRYGPALSAKAVVLGGRKFVRRWWHWRARFPYVAASGFVFTASLLGLTQVSDFLYFQF